MPTKLHHTGPRYITITTEDAIRIDDPATLAVYIGILRSEAEGEEPDMDAIAEHYDLTPEEVYDAEIGLNVLGLIGIEEGEL